MFAGQALHVALLDEQEAKVAWPPNHWHSRDAADHLHCQGMKEQVV